MSESERRKRGMHDAITLLSVTRPASRTEICWPIRTVLAERYNVVFNKYDWKQLFATKPAPPTEKRNPGKPQSFGMKTNCFYFPNPAPSFRNPVHVTNSLRVICPPLSCVCNASRAITRIVAAISFSVLLGISPIGFPLILSLTILAGVVTLSELLCGKNAIASATAFHGEMILP